VLALVIDTSSAAVTAAVVDVSAEPALRALRVTVDARAHGELLAPSIRDCLREAAITASDLAAVVAGIGPGPFTGLRVGLVTAAAMGDALVRPTYGVCSLDAIAYGSEGPLLVAGDARRREIYWATYLDGQRVEGPNVNRPADVPVDGPMAGAGARLWAEALGQELWEPDYPPALALAALGAERIRTRAPSETLTPLYLRRPDAVAPTEYKSVTP
jgi:tRNA threonylcarbamoyl adenosine modification protein YeaZ